MDDGLLINVDFDWQCYFELIKLTKFFTPKKTPVHLRWSWHWFSLTENFWTWLSETRSRGGARRAAQFFSSEKRPKLEIFAFWRDSRHPQTRAQFSKSRRASANRRPRPTACGLHPGPPKCLVARLGLWKLCPGPGVSAVVRISKELDLIKNVDLLCSRLQCLIVRFRFEWK